MLCFRIIQQDLAVALEQASDLAEGTGFEIRIIPPVMWRSRRLFLHCEVHRCFRKERRICLCDPFKIYKNSDAGITISADLLWMRLLMQELRLQLIPSELQESSSLKVLLQYSLLTVQTEALGNVQMVPLTEHRVQVLILDSSGDGSSDGTITNSGGFPRAAYRHQPDQNYLP